MNNRTKNMVLISLFAALTAVGGFLKIPIPPVPFTLQNFFVILAGILLGGKLALASQGIFMMIGLMGVPVFAQGGGIYYIFNPTFGYVLGFGATAYIVGSMVERIDLKGASFYKYLMISFIGLIVGYVIGIVYLYIILRYVNNLSITISEVLLTGFLIFLPWDIIKIAVASWLGGKVHRNVTVFQTK